MAALLATIERQTHDTCEWSVIWMPGLGADGADFVPVIPHLGLDPTVGIRFVLPNAPAIPVTCNGGYVMPAWYDIISLDKNNRDVDAAGIVKSRRQIRELIERDKERSVPSRQICRRLGFVSYSRLSASQPESPGFVPAHGLSVMSYQCFKPPATSSPGAPWILDHVWPTDERRSLRASHSSESHPMNHSPNRVRTSATDPLLIAELRPIGVLGRIGMSFCPGKIQTNAMTGGDWRRDLATDLQRVRDWGASAVLTLLENHELVELQVTGLGPSVRACGMAWHHLEIPDGGIPVAEVEAAALRVRADLQSRLVAGESVFIHCKGGLGRTGTLAALLLVDFGEAPDDALFRVRRARPGAIETAEQECYVRSAATSQTVVRSLPD